MWPVHGASSLTLPVIAEFEAGAQDLIIIKQDPARRHAGAKALWRTALVWVGVEAR
jgi:hypothetical protein